MKKKKKRLNMKALAALVLIAVTGTIYSCSGCSGLSDETFYEISQDESSDMYGSSSDDRSDSDVQSGDAQKVSGSSLQTGQSNPDETLQSGEEDSSESLQTGYGSSSKDLQSEAGQVIVYVCGQVVSPGVYTLREDARMNDAVMAAGGLLETAAADAVNLAAPIADGERIYIPTQEEASSGIGLTSDLTAAVSQETGMSDETGTLVNINTADQTLLMTLPGIGEAKAKSIIEYREKNGAFRSIEALKEVPGIKSGVYDGLCDRITVGT